jgi:hypothetical protein
MASNNQKDPLINSNIPFDKETMKDYFYEKFDKADKILQASLHKDLDKWHNDLNDLMPKSNKQITNASNKSCNLTSTTTEALIPRLVKTIFNYAYPIDCKGDNTELGKQLEIEVRKIIKWDIENNDDLYAAMWHLIANASGYGISFSYNYFQIEKKYIPVKVPTFEVNGQIALDAMGNPINFTPEQQKQIADMGHNIKEVKKIPRYEKYRPKSDCINAKRVVFPEGYSSMQDAFDKDFVGLKVYYTLNELFGMIEDKDALTAEISKVKAKEFASINNNSSSIQKVKALKGKQMEFWLIWGKYDIDNDEVEEYVVMLIHPKSKTLLGYQEYEFEHGRCPLVEAYIRPRLDQIPGIGMAEKLYDHKGYLDESRNDRINLRKQSLYPPLMHRKESGFNKTIHKFGYGEHWEIDFEHVKFFEMPAMNNFSFDDEAAVKQEAREIASLSDAAFGQQSKGDTTFRGEMQKLEEGSESRGMYTKWMCRAIKEIFLQRIMLVYQFLGNPEARKDPQIIKIVSKILDDGRTELTPITVDELMTGLDIIVTATNDDKKERLLKAQTKHDMLANDPNIQSSPKHFRKLIIDDLRAIGDEDPEGSYPTLEELEALQQQRVTIAQQEIQAQKEEAEKAQAFNDLKMRAKGRYDILGISEEIKPNQTESQVANG